MLEKFKSHLEEQDKSVNTIESYLRSLTDYSNWFLGSYGKKPVKLFKPNILEYISFLKNIKKQNGKTINAKLSALKKFNEYLIKVSVQPDLVITNNMKIKIQQQYASPATITKKEVGNLRQIVLEKGSKRDYALMNLLVYTGVRISEALNILISDCNNICVTKELIIRNGKGNKQRIVVLNDKVIESIKDYIKHERDNYKTASNSEYLFVSTRNPQLDRITVNKMLDKYCKLGRLENINPHLLRHYFCSNALEKGWSLAEVANQAGHSNPHTTLIYTNPNRNKMIQKANDL